MGMWRGERSQKLSDIVIERPHDSFRQNC